MEKKTYPCEGPVTVDSQKKLKINQKKKLPVRVPSQRRLAISRLRVPNLDGSVATAAGNLFSIGTPRHRDDPEIVRSQDTNQQKQRRGKLGENNLGKKNLTLSGRSGSTPQIPGEHHRPPPGTPLPAPVLIHLGRRPRHASHHPLASSICMRGAIVVG